MSVTIIDKSSDFLRRLENAIDRPGGALDAATQELAGKIQEGMYTSGAAGIPNDTPTKDQPPSAPGRPPSVKTGRLAGSIKNAKVGKLRWAAGTNVAYARIHEFGGTINHPGGTAFLTFGGKAAWVKNENAKPWMRRTRPHPIVMPARPFIRPALRNNRKKIGKVFNDRLRELMGAGA